MFKVNPNYNKVKFKKGDFVENIYQVVNSENMRNNFHIYLGIDKKHYKVYNIIQKKVCFLFRESKYDNNDGTFEKQTLTKIQCGYYEKDFDVNLFDILKSLV